MPKFCSLHFFQDLNVQSVMEMLLSLAGYSKNVQLLSLGGIYCFVRHWHYRKSQSI